MATDFKLPDLGENIESGDVVSLLVQEGDEIQAGQGVVELETGKAVVEVPCPHAGRVSRIHVKKGDKVPVGSPLVTIEQAEGKPPKPHDAESKPAATDTDGEAAKKTDKQAAGDAMAKKAEAPRGKPQGTVETPRPAPPSPAPQKPQPARPGPQPLAATPSMTEDDGPAAEPAPAAPATRRLARELGVDLAHVQGTGPGGRITREDVMAAVREANQQPAEAEAPPAPRSAPRAAPAPVPPGVDDKDPFGPVRRVPLTRIRKTIAVNMARSSATIPHVTNFDDADITELERIRKTSLEDYAASNIKLTTMAFILKAVAHSLRLHPAVNVSLDMESDQAVYKQYVNIGVAVDTERGLVVPVIRDADRLSIPQLAAALTAVAAKARSSQFSMSDLQGGTFTVSNLGAIGGTYSTPIINYPEVAVLLVGRSRQLPVVIDDNVAIRLMAPLSISYDHRWVDGAAAARFLNEVKGYLEAPARLMLAP